ncbi:hypothetical protein E1189_04110 [Sansalvadorimonas verongulae]|nr:hypothetical protein [Sansalvadorimonas verongulae]
MLGDANFENYFLLVLLRLAGADVVFEKHGARHIDFRQCDKKLGKKDGLFVLKRPPCPEWMSRTFYKQCTPEELTVRAIKSRKRIIMTTLVDDKRYTRAEINALYLRRWHVELDLRSMKTLMKMDVLRCKSPDMVRKEISVHLLAYNLLRALMARTAQIAGQTPREISFKATQQTLQDFHSILLRADHPAGVIEDMLNIMAEHQVGNRPGRSEPRAVKRRPKAFPKLQHTRSKA